MTGSWNVNVVINGMPQKVATAFSALANQLIGAEYEPIAYLGSQVVNGTNHAVLAKQILTTGRDTTNIVVIVFNEKPGAMEDTLVSIDRVVEGGAPLGGVQLNPQTDIPDNAMDAWNEAFGAWVGAKLEPIALLGTQVVKGTNFIFAATVTPVVPDATAKASIVTINPMIGTVAFDDLLSTKYEASLGYAFTWLKGGLGKPLGEWP
jgi:hypothetical protein